MIITHVYKFSKGELVCTLEYEPAEKGSWDERHPAGVVLLSAEVKGVDIIDFLDNSVVEQIEHSALDAQESDHA